jgi:outer membrane protein assembly factor BamB/TolA-binding protein
MPFIEIRRSTGKLSRWELSKVNPLSIGSHETCNIRVEEDAVASMQCRIGWNRDSYEVIAATREGVEVNGSLVRHRNLASGDIIRVGTIDITYVDEVEEPDSTDDPESEIELKPDTHEKLKREQLAAKDSDRQVKDRKGAGAVPSEHPQVDENGRHVPGASFDALYIEENDVDEALGTGRPPEPQEEELSSTVLPRLRAPQDNKDSSTVDRVRSDVWSRSSRPGEQDVIRSPFVLGLGAVVLFLTLAAATFWLLIGRDDSQRLYDAALRELSDGRYAQAIALFEEFQLKYPRHDDVILAQFAVGRARIDLEISGSIPNWKRGFDQVLEFIQQNRDYDEFHQQHDMLREYAEQIAMGVAQSAEAEGDETEKRRELLALAKEAVKVVDRFPPGGSRQALDEFHNSFRTAYTKAENAIIKREEFDAAVARIEDAIAQHETMAAFAARVQLIDKYADFADHKTVVELLEKTLKAEQARVVREVLDRAASHEEPPSVLPQPLTLTPHTRSRTDELSTDRTVIALAKDCCYGVDTVTGEPRWRRVIGRDTPFFPIQVATSIPGLLLYDTNRSELMLIDIRSGSLVWRQALAEELAGPPLVHEGQAYLPTLGQHLYQFDLQTGDTAARLKFSQRVLAPPALSTDKSSLFVAGDEDVMYALSLRPLACRSVSYLGHRKGSITAPVVTMGWLLLVAENDRLQQAELRVLDTRGDKPLEQVASVRIDGNVWDRPALRGKQLFVPSSSGRIAAFAVSDDSNQPPLSPVARYQERNAYDGPTYLAIGSGGQLWTLNDALRKLQVKTDTINLNPATAAIGIATQPLQNIGQQFYVGRRFPYCSAIFFTRVDGEEMTSHWRLTLGAAPISWEGAVGSSGICLNASGSIFRISARDLEAGGFHFDPLASLRLPDDLDEPLRAVVFDDGTLAIHAGGSEPRLWLINRLGQIEQSYRLQQPLEADPVLLASGVVLPLPGTLKLLGRSSSATHAEAYQAPITQNEKPTWRFLAALDREQLIAVDSSGALTRIQHRDTPAPHLALVASLDLEQQLDVAFTVHEGKLVLADAAGRLRLINASTMDLLDEITLDAPASSDLWIVDNRLFVEIGRERLACYAVDSSLKQVWSIPVEEDGLSGKPVVADQRLVVAQRSGTILALNKETGEVLAHVNLGQRATLGPKWIENFLVVPAGDGSLHRIESILEAGEK